MDEVKLAKSGLRVSRLGFGCAPLMASLDMDASLRLLETASDSGITHFDVARSYGYGEAETALGRFAKGRRDTITIATKFGIQPPGRHLAAGPIKESARALARIVPLLRPLLRRGAANLQKVGAFDVEAARKSLDTSLALLRTDYVDLLMLHECRETHARDENLRRFLEDCIAAGKLRAWGIATHRGTTRLIIDEDNAPAVAQFADSPLQETGLLEQARSVSDIVVHSALSGLKRIEEHLADVPTTRRWSDAVGDDLAKPRSIPRYLLAASLDRVGRGCVLISSRDPERVRENALLAAGTRPAQSAVGTFLTLVRAELPELAEA